MNLKCSIDVAGTGFTVLDLIYSGDTKIGEGLGGSCGNVLWSLAMLQRAVVPVLRLGADDVADELVASFDAAGADTTFIERAPGGHSPILIQHVDLTTGGHYFSSRKPASEDRFPRYTPIGHDHVRKASDVFRSCSVLYTDRSNAGVVEAMEATKQAGGLVYFEPSEVGDEDLFRRALAAATIVKFSDERMGEFLPDGLADGVYLIVTMGALGLRIHHGAAVIQCGAVSAPAVRDTSGSGDMVSVGLIDFLLAGDSTRRHLEMADVVFGVQAGQRLAAANCAYVGARGIFTEAGIKAARRALEDHAA